MTSDLQRVIDRHVAQGTAPGIVVATGSTEEPTRFLQAGDLSIDAIARIQSMTKPVLAVATLRLIQGGMLTLDDPVEHWVPELANRRVLRSPDGPLEDTIPAERPITVRHLLTNTSGYGMMTSDCPLQRAMIANQTQAGQEPVALGAQDWVAALSDLPLAFQPGTGWRYHHSFGLLGILLSRLVGGELARHLREDIFAPLGMHDTGYTVPTAQAHRLPAAYRHLPNGPLVEVEPAGSGFYVAPADFDLSHAELVSTVSDYAAFARMLAASGWHGGQRLLEPGLLELMRSDQIPKELKTADSFFPGFWNETGWGFGVAVQTSGAQAGRYGWSGGLGTNVHIDPDGSFQVLFTQVEMGPQLMGLLAEVQ
ncbi:serine hydrolase domain-containing protein [Glutamicibacter endophyticus]|uniref:serine hydrolase domain-containing protein n=1 Tax=Glutamicibacter endophyticus TaxID=1522174 RepID=UPI003AF05076